MTEVFKLTFQVQDGHHLLLSDLLEEELAAHAVSLTKLEEHDNLWSIEAYFEAQPDPEEIKNFLQHHFAQDRNSIDFATEILPDEDWVSHVQSNLAPVPAGRFIIHGSHDRDKMKSCPFAIQIDAGQAFGTAHHGTTRGCLLAIERILKRKTFQNILDIGTGTGVLAIAASKMQKTAHVTASDIDPIAVLVAQENCQINHTSHLIDLICAPGLDHQSLKNKKPYDLIIANILAKPLQMLSPDFAKAVMPGGHIILSGLLASQAREVTASYLQNGFVLEGRIPMDGWMTLIMRQQGRRIQKLT